MMRPSRTRRPRKGRWFRSAVARIWQPIAARPRVSLYLIAALALGVLILLASILKTDTRRASGVISGTIRALERADVEGTLKHLADDYFYAGMDTGALGEFLADVINAYGVPSVHVLSIKTAVEDGSAVTDVNCWATGSRRPTNETLRCLWRFWLEKADGKWHITGAQPMRVGSWPSAGWAELRTRVQQDLQTR